MARARQLERTWEDLAELQAKLRAPGPATVSAAKVTQAVEAILQGRGTTAWVVVAIDEHEEAIYRQERPGRPNRDTTYRREVKARYKLRYELDQAALTAEAVQDGVFPLITNDRELSERALLLAYKGQPVIERRYAQLKTEFAVAPVYLKEVTPIRRCSACTSWCCWCRRCSIASCGAGWRPGGGEPADLSRGPSVPVPHHAAVDQTVRECATPSADRRRGAAGGHDDHADRAPVPGPEPPRHADGLRQLT